MASPSTRHATSKTTILATNTMQSVLLTLNESGASRRAYAPYGHSADGNIELGLLSFNGERREPLTHHYSLGNGHRVFNPVTMRFNTPDALSPFGAGGMHAYAYCANDPINRTDPTGRISRLWGVVRKNISKLAAKRHTDKVYPMPGPQDFAWRPPQAKRPQFGPQNLPENDLMNYFKLQPKSLFQLAHEAILNHPPAREGYKHLLFRGEPITQDLPPSALQVRKDIAATRKYIESKAEKIIPGDRFYRAWLGGYAENEKLPSELRDILRRL